MYYKFCILSAILCFFTGSPYAQKTINSEKLNQFFEQLSHHQKFMGSVAMVQNGKTVYTYATGFSNINQHQKSNNNTLYHIGSISKTYTAALMLLAQEEGKLSLQTKISTWFPAIANAGSITIQQLLQHESGIFNFTNDSTYLNWHTQPKTREEIERLISSYTPAFPPGTQQEYSNSNYILLSLILEKIYQLPLETIIEQKITTPLKLSATHLPAVPLDATINNSYNLNSTWQLSSVTHPSLPLGAGAIIASSEDVAQFFSALFSRKVLSDSSLQQMTTIKGFFGLGLTPVPYGTKKGFGHTGGIDGYRSFAICIPKDSLTIAITANALNYEINDIMITLLQAAFNEPFAIPDFSLKQEDLVALEGTYTCTDLPFSIVITADNGILTAQASGQSKFILNAEGNNLFRFPAAGLAMKFFPETNKMTLEQGGQSYAFSKEIK